MVPRVTINFSLGSIASYNIILWRMNISIRQTKQHLVIPCKGNHFNLRSTDIIMEEEMNNHYHRCCGYVEYI